MAKNLDRAAAFVRAFEAPGGSKRAPGKPSTDEVELLRGSLVFAIGALDAFMHDLIIEIVPAFGPPSSGLQDALRAIAKADPGLSLQLALAETRDRARETFKESLENWLGNNSFHGPEGVGRGLSFLGLEMPHGGIDVVASVPKAGKTLKRMTEVRHQIVHRGAQPLLKRDDANGLIDVVTGIGDGVNQMAVEAFYR